MSQQEHINKLKSDIRSLEEGNRRLEAGSKENAASGQSVRAFKGTGDRQYLTGVTITGKHVLVLIDMSASMLDETLVNILRMRNLPDVQKMLAPKWQRAVATVDWLTTQIPPDSEFQVYAFNTEAHSVVEGNEGKWLKAVDPRPLNAAVQKLKHMFPHDGTSLINAFNAAKTLDPLPDQIVLVTDGLPTQGATPPALRKAVDVEQRAKLFDQSSERAAAQSAGEHDPAADGRRSAGAGALLAPGARDRRCLHGALEGLAMKLKRHATEVFSMSFLDCICCGFGAMILILVLTETGQPVVLEKVRTDMHGQVAKLQAELYEIRGETDVLNRDLKGRIEQLSTERSKLARLQGDLSTVKGQYNTSEKEAEIQNAEEGQLVAAYQKLTSEMERLLKAGYRRPKNGRDRRHPGGQRIRHLRGRHFGEHARESLGNGPQDDAGDPRHLSQGEGHPGDGRRGRVHVRWLSRAMDRRHAGAAQGDHGPVQDLDLVQQLEPGGGAAGGDPHVLGGGQEGEHLLFRR